MRFSRTSFISIVCMVALSHANVSGQKLKTINHIILIGQSLGAGEESLPIVTDSATGYGNLRFKIGTHTCTKRYFEDKPWLRDPALFKFVPLTAVEREHEGETIGNGVCDHLKNTITPFESAYNTFLYSFTGQGGRLIRELDKHDYAKDLRSADRHCGGGFYNTVVDDVKRAKKMALLQKKKYKVSAITWMQGESNRLGHVARWDPPVQPKEKFMEIYLQDLIQLKNDLQYDICKITGQQDTIPFFTYQTAGDNIGMAQLIACNREKGMYMVGATYMLPNAMNSRLWGTQQHGYGIHLSADGQRWLGEMFGKVIRKVVFEQQTWKPLQPLEAIFSEDRSHIRVKFHVPSPPLVLDTFFLPKQGKSFGFEVYNNNNNRLGNITTAQVINDSIIELTLSETLNKDSLYHVRYGLLNYVNDVSKVISNIVEDTVINKSVYTGVEFNGNIVNEFLILSNEGVFVLANQCKDSKQTTSLRIRMVFLNKNGNTELLGEKSELRESVQFVKGQNCFTQREFGYGNVRDSDTEVSTFTFKDKQYGQRYGQKYPLQNWLVVFDNLPVKQYQK